MRHKRISLLFMVPLVLLGACSMKKPMPQRIVEQKAVPSFTKISVHGNIDVEFKTQQKKPQLYLYADNRDISHIKTQVRGDVLHINVDHDYPKHGPIMAKVDTRFINRLDYDGEGNIFTKNAKSALLDLNLNTTGQVQLAGKLGLRNVSIEGNGKTIIQGISSRDLNIRMQGEPFVQLQGVANLKHLTYSGAGWLGLYWVSSDELKIDGSGEAYVQLAGVSKTLFANLIDKSHLNAKYLRADTAYVKTFNQATADIQVVKNQNAVASDESNIFYFNDPPYSGNFMAHNGAIMEMPENW